MTDITLSGSHILQIVVAIVTGLVGVVYWRLIKDLQKTREDVEQLQKELQNHAFPAFKAMDDEREKHWLEWRADLDERMKKMERRISRLYRYMSQVLSSLQKSVYTLMGRVRGMERRDNDP